MSSAICFNLDQSTILSSGNGLIHLAHYHTNPRVLMILGIFTFENIVGKGEDAGYQQFLLFPQCFDSWAGQPKNYCLSDETLIRGPVSR